MNLVCMDCHGVFRDTKVLKVSLNNMINFKCPVHRCEGDLVEIDEGIVDLILAFWKSDIDTAFCCSGHINDYSKDLAWNARSGAPYIMFFFPVKGGRGPRLEAVKSEWLKLFKKYPYVIIPTVGEDTNHDLVRVRDGKEYRSFILRGYIKGGFHKAPIEKRLEVVKQFHLLCYKLAKKFEKKPKISK